MKNSSASEFAHSSYSALVSRSLTASDVEVSLLPFYLGLDFDARRRRFGGGVCDDAIRQHCRALNLDNAIVLACSGRAGLIAAIELHPLVHDWENTELALAECAEADRTTIVAHLLQLAAFAAGKSRLRYACRSILLIRARLSRIAARNGACASAGRWTSVRATRISNSAPLFGESDVGAPFLPALQTARTND
jgi:hypothetical protein